MNFLELIQILTGFLQTLSQVATKLTSAAPAVSDAVERMIRPAPYENLALDLKLEIRDPHGSSAVLEKRQRVRVLSSEPALIRDLVWGEGRVLARYSTYGARRLGVQPEGSRQAVFLALTQQPARGESVTVRSRPFIEAGFTEPLEYFDAFVERPTRRLALKVIFPLSRPPQDASLIAEGAQLSGRKIPVRYGSDGRPFLTWSKESPVRFRTYSLRWRW